MKLEDILDEELLKVNQENLNDLKKKLKDGGVTFVLGAGVSMQAGLPAWDGLLAQVWARVLETEIPTKSQKWKDIRREEYAEASESARKKAREGKSTEEDYIVKAGKAFGGEYKRLFSGMNLLEVAEYIRNYVKTILPVDSKEERRHLEASIIDSMIKEVTQIPDGEIQNMVSRMEGSFLQRLAAFLAEKEDTYRCDVITYNYDNLLEFFLLKHEKCDMSRIHLVCEGEEDKSFQNEKINIFHPHGYLSVVDSGNNQNDTEKIILTESSYYEIEGKAYCWENSIQAKALIDSTCIFAGFSGQDYNFRRMVKNMEHIEDENNKKHYIFFSIDTLAETLFGGEALKRMKKEAISEILSDSSITSAEAANRINALVDSDEIGRNADGRACYAKYIKQNAASDEFAYENVQLIHFLYAQYMYWSYHGIFPIWTTYEELPKIMQELSGGNR